MGHQVVLKLSFTTLLSEARLSYGAKAGINIAKLKFSSADFKTKPTIDFNARFCYCIFLPETACRSSLFFQPFESK